MATTQQPPQPQPATSVALSPLQKKYGTMMRLLETKNVQTQIERALPQAMNGPRFLRIALTELRANAMLLQCAPESVIGSIIQAAQLGLELDRQLGQGYLIPYKIDGEWVCQFQPGYRGYVQLSRRSGEIKSLGAQVVHDGEYFEYEQGTDPYLKHRPDVEFEDHPVTHVYAVVLYTNGGVDFEVMSHAGVEKVRAKSKAPNSPAWQGHWDEMAKAKVIRRLAKRLPVSAENAALVKAAVLDEQADAGVSQNNAAVLEADANGYVNVVPPANALGHDATLANKAHDNLAGIKEQYAQQPAPTSAAHASEGISGRPSQVPESASATAPEPSFTAEHGEISAPDGLPLDWQEE